MDGLKEKSHRWGGAARIAVVLLLGLVALALAACPGENDAPDVATEKVARETLKVKVEARTELKALKSRSVEVPRFPTGKILLKITKLIPEGTEVKEGDLLVSLDKTEIEKRQRDVVSDVKSAKAQQVKAEKVLTAETSRVETDLTKAQAEVEARKIELDLCLARPGAVELAGAKCELDKARKAEELKKAELEAVRALVEAGCESSLKLAKAELEHEIAQVDREIREKELEALKTGPPKKDACEARLDLEEARLKLERAQLEKDYQVRTLANDVEVKRLGVEKQDELMSRWEKAMENADFYAARPGIVNYSKIWQGSAQEKIKEGMTVRFYNQLMSLEDATTMVAKAEVEEAQISLIRPGLPATIRLDAVAGETFTGKVCEIGSIAQEPGEKENGSYGAAKKEPSGVRVFLVKVEVTEKDPRLRTGMSGDLVVVVEEIPNVISVPQKAVFKEGERSLVYVWHRGRARAREVVAGRTVQGRVIVEKGLKEGEDVCLVQPEVEM